MKPVQSHVKVLLIASKQVEVTLDGLCHHSGTIRWNFLTPSAFYYQTLYRRYRLL